MFYGLTFTHIITLYYTVRTMHGIYISYNFLSWLLLSSYGFMVWILSYIPIPSLQITQPELYYAIDSNDYIEIKEY